MWIDQAYFLVEQLDNQVFDITLPNTNWGTRYASYPDSSTMSHIIMSSQATVCSGG